MFDSKILPQRTDIVVRCWPFFTVVFIYILIGLILQSYYGKDELPLLLAGQGHTLPDILFKTMTLLGTLPIALCAAILIAWRYRWYALLCYVMANAFQLVLVEGIKHAFFATQLRPVYYFQKFHISFHVPNGVSHGMYHHFPSGHTTMAFTLFFCLALCSTRRWWQGTCALLAIMVAYSRLYLVQHFMLDTIGGALIALFSVVLSYYITLIYKNKIIQQKKYTIATKQNSI